MYRPLLIVLAGLVAAVAPVAPAMARSCGAQAPIEDEFASSSAVLLGRVIAISSGQREYSTDVPGEILRIATRVATVEVEREWKGPDHGIVAIETCALCTTAARFEVGDRLVVFAHNDYHGVSSCSRTYREADPRFAPTLGWLERRAPDALVEVRAPAVRR